MAEDRYECNACCYGDAQCDSGHDQNYGCATTESPNQNVANNNGTSSNSNSANSEAVIVHEAVIVYEATTIDIQSIYFTTSNCTIIITFSDTFDISSIVKGITLEADATTTTFSTSNNPTHSVSSKHTPPFRNLSPILSRTQNTVSIEFETKSDSILQSSNYVIIYPKAPIPSIYNWLDIQIPSINFDDLQNLKSITFPTYNYNITNIYYINDSSTEDLFSTLGKIGLVLKC